MKELGLEGKIITLLVVLSVIPIATGGYILTEQSMHELNHRATESLIDMVRGKATLYGEEFSAFKSDAGSMATYISSTWNRSYDGNVNASYIWISPNGTGYYAHENELKNFESILDGFDLVVGNNSKVELAYFGMESGVLFFNKPVVPIIEELKPFDYRTRPWYVMAKESNATIWTPVYVDANTKKLVTTVASPVYIDNKFAGVVGFDLLLETIQQDILDTKFTGSGYGMLVDGNGNIIVHPEYTAGNKTWNETFVEENIFNIRGLKSVGEDMVGGNEGAKSVVLNGMEFYVAYSPVNEINGSIAFLIEKDKITGQITAMRGEMYIGVIGLTAIVAILGMLLARSITRPLENLVEGAKEVASGNLDYRVKTNAKGEIGKLTETFNKMVDELKNSRKKLEQSEKKYRELFESSKDGVYVTSKDGNLVDINKAGEELFGYTKEELLNKNMADTYADKGEREKFIKEMEEKGFVKDYEVKYRRKDGKIITCLETASVKRDENGNVIGYQGLVKDITKLREVEKRVELYNSLMRHDISNMSQIARGYVEILRDTELTDEQKKFANRALDMIESSQNLIRKVRGINKAKEEHNLGKFDIDEIIKKSIAMYLPHAEEEGIEIKYDGKSIGVIADEMADDIFSNIIGNAVMHSGCSRIDISVDDDGKFCKVTIKDNGKGIPEDIKDNIFDWGTRSKDSKGSGLGLYLVKTIVDSYGGKIEVKGREKGGTVFEVYLRKWEKTDE